MSFRLVPNSVTLDDVERRSVISPKSLLFGSDYVKVVEDTPILLQRECRKKNLVFSDILFMTILQVIIPSDSVKVRHSPLANENLTNNHNFETV